MFLVSVCVHMFGVGLGLYELWKTGRYKSYPPSVLVDLTARILALVPPWTRVYRVQRFATFLLYHSDSNFLHLLHSISH